MTELPEFTPWPKTPRWNRDVVVTEKIDGTNAAVVIPEDGSGVFAQSRKKVITPGKQTDNFGFARWVEDNKDSLFAFLGFGIHFGEWYGSGIQSTYGLTNGERRFMLFNSERWNAETIPPNPIGLEHATVLYTGLPNTYVFQDIIAELQDHGSKHVLDWLKAEGIIIYHTAARIGLKMLVENDEGWKGEGS